MSSGFYDRVAKTALEKIRQYGQPMTLRHWPGVPSTNYDTGTGTMDKGAPVDYEVSGLVWAPSDTSIGSESLTGGSSLKSERTAMIQAAGLDCVPAPNDRLIVDGISWEIFEVDSLSPGGIPVYHEVSIRRGDR